MEIELYKPHKGQLPMHQSNARFKIAACGRRFGKTYMAINEVVKFANENAFAKTLWVAPTYRQSKLAQDIIVREFQKAFDGYTKNPMEIKWINGSVTKFLSTESKDTLRGDNADLIIADESSMIDEEVWTNVLRPMLSDTQGKAILISTPRGLNNWFHRLYTRGEDPTYPDYESFKFPTSANPYIALEEIEEVKNSLPHDVFRQEYMAEFLEDTGAVFRNVMGCIATSRSKLPGSQPLLGRQYIIGLDIAKHTDFSVIVVLDAKYNHLVYFDRFNRVDYSVQIERVVEVSRKYNKAKIILDSTGVGDPILESIKKKCNQTEGFLFTNKSKQQLIEHLAVLLEKQEISYPDIKVLTNELLSYQYEISRAGNMIYNAPSGVHDDCVIALALAAWGVKHQRNPRVILI